MKKLKLLIVFSLSVFFADAQFVLSGKIADSSGELLAGAAVQLKSKDIKLGTIANTKGVYEFTDIKKGDYIVSVSFLGFQTISKNISITQTTTINFKLPESSYMAEEVIVSSTRASDKTPVTFSIVKKGELEKNNLGQDLPLMLSMEPSIVTTTDAGAGVGYTGLRIRGSNIQRINVTVNGIPLNDPESHGVFFVNMPDFTSSLNSVQVQRGVGTSTNGGGAFGATINMQTDNVETKAFGEVNSSVGAFNTLKNNVRFGTGMLKGKWAFEGRLSKITSDGYIDRASSDLKSFFVQGGYYTDNTTVKAVIFSGKEKTYQAWWGVDQWTIDNLGRTFNWAGVIYNKYGSMRFYDNQTDNYQQDHYQLHISQKLLSNLRFNAALHYTYGRGYYEEYNQNEDLNNYPIGYQYFGYDSVSNGSGGYNYFYHDTIKTSDIITRRWLDNDFYGATYSFDYINKNLNIVFGGAVNKYANARHFGEIIWAQFTGNTNICDTYYDNTSNKFDLNNYLKVNYQVLPSLNIFGDLQMRMVDYTASGIDKGGAIINIDKNYTFFNPKFGLTYSLAVVGDIYSSFAIANREPVRTDFIDAPDDVTPEPEKLNDIEFGIRKKDKSYFYTANLFYMKYKNQLVLTGELNDVGAPIRANVGESYNMGVELDGGIKPINWFALRANLALSASNTDYKEENNNNEIINYNNVQLSLTPQTVGGAQLSFYPVKNAEIGVVYRYISKQYLDLTQNNSRILDAYTFTNINLAYSFYPEFMQEIKFTLLVNNVFNQLYASNGYMWGSTPYYYPQAGINFLTGVKLRF
jgi:iron complex outermembrane receptor protein